MKRIRIGNDINVVWSLMRDDAPFLLNAEKISLYLMAPYGRVELTDYSVEGNSVTWLFQGRHQKAIGKYTLVLVVNKGEEGMITTDACDFVELVSCSCKADGADACGVETEYVNLVSKVDVGGGSGGGSSYDDTEIRTELSRLDAVKAEKAELTELSEDINTKTETYIPEFTIEDIRNAIDGGYNLQVDLKDITAVQEGKTIRVREGEYGSHPCAAIIDENDILHLTIYASTHVYETEIDDGADMRIRGVLEIKSIEIVNNLTQGGKDVALSAEMGKEIGSILNVHEVEKTEKNYLEDGKDYTSSVGYAVGTGESSLNTWNENFRRTSIISMKKGDIIEVSASGPDSISIIALWDSSTSKTTPLVIGQGYNKMIEVSYIAEADCEVIASWHVNNNMALGYIALTSTKKVTESSLTILSDDVKNLQQESNSAKNNIVELTGQLANINDALGIEHKEGMRTKELIANVDYYEKEGYVGVNDAGFGISINANFRNTGDLHLKVGERVVVKASAPNNVSIIAIKVEEGKYKTIAIGEAWNKIIEVEYIAVEDCDILISYQVSNNMTHSIVATMYDMWAESDMIKDIKKIPLLEGDVKEIEKSVLTKIEDNFSQGYIAGAYINHNGEIKSNSDFGYKEFSISTGTKVYVKCNMVNPSVAFLAKKLNTPLSTTRLFEEIVAGANYTEQEVEYVANEDMTIAISFGLSYIEKNGIYISLTSNAIESNALKIANLQSKAEDLSINDIDLGFLFNKIAVIGDSLASGRVEGIEGESDAVGADFYGYSWLAFLSKRWGCEKYKNFSRAGQKTLDWLSEWLEKMKTDIVYDAYFIALGTNNEYNESNIDRDKENYDAFVERYNTIIDEVRAKAPNAAIFLVSLYEKRQGNAALESIATARMENDEGIYYIDYANNAQYHRYSPNVNWRGHFSTTGYAYVAKVINEIVSQIIWENQTKEFWQQFAKHH